MRVEFEFRKTANLLWHTVTVGIFPLILALGACGGSGSGPTPPCTSCTPGSTSDYVYEANANQVTIFEVDSTDGHSSLDAVTSNRATDTRRHGCDID